MKNAAVRRVGWGLIGVLWFIAAYLVVHVALLDPVKVLGVLLLVSVGAAVWTAPFAIAFATSWFLLRASLQLTRRGRALAAAFVSAGITAALPCVD